MYDIPTCLSNGKKRVRGPNIAGSLRNGRKKARLAAFGKFS